MGQVYSKADRVVAWLAVEQRKWNEQHLTVEDQRSDDRQPPTPKLWKSLTEPELRLDIRLNPYWRRIWIIQEVSKARSVEVWYGGSRYQIDNLLEFLLPAAGVTDTSVETEAISAIQFFRVRERQSHIAVPRMLLSEALLRSRMSLATDLRDKFYALLSLTLDGNELVQTPNYSQHPSQVFQAATFAMIHNQGQVAVMLLAGERGGAHRSWLPDWSNLGGQIPPWIIQHVLCERETLEGGYLTNGTDAIGITGKHFDSIGHTSAPDSGQHVKQSGRVKWTGHGYFGVHTLARSDASGFGRLDGLRK